MKEPTGSLPVIDFQTTESQTEATASPDINAQLYEGEWKSDKRHGHGMLKIPGYYTYYGEWEGNTRTGYGVMMYTSGRKEEGQWLGGRLVVALRRRKLAMNLQKVSLESKVKQAHALAIQAADKARNKAMVAESRAQVAGAKASSALKNAQQALMDARIAREKSDLYKNAPRIAGMWVQEL